MKLLRSWCGALLLSAVSAFAADRSAEFEAFMVKSAEDTVRQWPMWATATQYFEGAEQDALDRKIDAGTFEKEKLEFARRFGREKLARLKEFSEADLTPRQRISHATLLWAITNGIELERFDKIGYVFTQIGGYQNNVVGFLNTAHPIRNERDVENYLVRLSQVSKYMRIAIAEAAEREALGIIPPKFILISTLKGIDTFLAPAPEKNALIESLKERLAGLKDLPEEKRAAATAAATAIVAKDIIPVFRELREFLDKQQAKATDEAGFSAQPGGAEAYAAYLKTSTTTDLTPDQIHEIGLKEVARIETELDKLLKQVGYPEGSVKDRIRALNTSLIPPETPESRDQILARFTEILKDADNRAKEFFEQTPKAPLVVKREPAFSEAGATAHYVGPAPDGSRPGIFFCPLPSFTADQIWLGSGMKTVAYHEGIPGHHYQIALTLEMADAPIYVRKRILPGSTAYTEGWALYAERLAVEAGWYGDDLIGRIGQLNLELMRAKRLVVDTGIHAKGWTRQQAIDYGFSPAEIERYCVWPGQACAYKIGELKILELRARAKQALGDRFDLKKFHSVVLGTGSVPLAVLEKVVDEWIASEK